jgi:hypothetical protein
VVTLASLREQLNGYPQQFASIFIAAEVAKLGRVCVEQCVCVTMHMSLPPPRVSVSPCLLFLALVAPPMQPTHSGAPNSHAQFTQFCSVRAVYGLCVKHLVCNGGTCLPSAGVGRGGGQRDVVARRANRVHTPSQPAPRTWHPPQLPSSVHCEQGRALLCDLVWVLQ